MKDDLSTFGKWASTDEIKKHYISEKKFLCPKCAKQFEGELKGVCPDCGYSNQILYLWINPKYKMEKSK